MPLILSGSQGISSNGATYLAPNNAGYITQPGIPAFFVTGPSAYVSYGNAVKITHFQTAIFNNGGHYSLVNSRFTAPIAGHYQFNTHHLHNVSQVGSISYYINGSERTRKYVESSRSNNIDMVAFLNVGDFVELYTQDGAQTLYGGPYAGFSGHFIG
jgi:hypothetical protein